MTADELVARIGRLTSRIKVLRDDNQRLWASREEWKQKYRVCMEKNTRLRRDLSRAREQRETLRARVPRRRTRRPETGLRLTQRDIDRILSIPPRD